jgi:CBS domain-containing protein
MTTAIDLDRALVADHMHVGVLVCAPESSLVDVAGMMAEHRVHSVVVLGDGEGVDGWSVVSDLDVAEQVAAGSLEGRTAASCAASPTIVVHPGDSLTRAAQLMAENGVAHLVVSKAHPERPLGIFSTLDLARAIVGE